MLADRHAGAGRIQEADRLVRQLPRRDIAVGKPHGGLDRLIQQLHLVVLLHYRGHPPHHENGLIFAGLANLHDLKAAGEGRIFLDMLLILSPGCGGNRAQRAAGQGRLQQVGRIARPRSAAGADERMGLINEEDDWLLRGLHLLNDLAEPLLEFALHARAGLQEANVQRQEADIFHRRRHRAGGQSVGEAFDHGRLADARLAGKNGIVLPAAHEDIDNLTNLFIAADDGIDLALAGAFREIDGILLKGLLFA